MLLVTFMLQRIFDLLVKEKGGKWILRLKKGFSSRIWENLVLAMIGEQFLVGEEICGAVCSTRNQEDIASLWNRTADNLATTNRIRDTLRRVLNLPPNAILECHDDCLKHVFVFVVASLLKAGES
uniref:Uncharacterized protein n=1 Tax=Wuchereria bancrofti TaxID=6293 RepID=A0A1I8EJU9_WUCBA